MARLRLFAQAREAAGTGEAVIDGATVGAVLDASVERFGPRFSDVLASCRVWVNGDPADRSDTVSATDEVAVLPPVSGRRVTRTAELADRYLVIPDLRGPKIRRTLLWAVGLLISLAVSVPALALFLGVTAAVAALQTTARWRDAGVSANQWLAAGGAFVIVMASAVGNFWTGAALVAFGLAAAVFPEGGVPHVPTSWTQVGDQAWGTLASGMFVAVAAASAVQLERIDALTFVFLVGAASTYDAGDFLCTEGPRKPWVGPLAGMVGVAIVAVAVGIAKPPPFTTTQAIVMGLIMVVLCPAGQLFGSWLLPRPRAHAPALRRLDSWMLAGPVLLAAAWIAQ